MTLYITIQYIDKQVLKETIGTAVFLLTAVIIWSFIKKNKQ